MLYAAALIESEGCVRFPRLQIMTFSLVGGLFWLSSATDVVSQNLAINHSILLFFTSYHSTPEAVPILSSCIFMMDMGHVLRRGHQSLLAQQDSEKVLKDSAIVQKLNKYFKNYVLSQVQTVQFSPLYGRLR